MEPLNTPHDTGYKWLLSSRESSTGICWILNTSPG